LLHFVYNVLLVIISEFAIQPDDGGAQEHDTSNHGEDYEHYLTIRGVVKDTQRHHVAWLYIILLLVCGF